MLNVLMFSNNIYFYAIIILCNYTNTVLMMMVQYIQYIQ